MRARRLHWRFLLLAAAFPAAAAPGAAGRGAFVGKYCLGCHNTRSKAGGFVLEGVNAADPAARPDVWEKAIKRVRAREMPPEGMPRPDDPAAAEFTSALASELDAHARRAPFAGAPVIRRLNRTEYGNAIRDLLHLDLNVSAELPPDQSAAGFDNIADALSMSPLLLEQYLKVARRVSEIATGTGDASPVVEIFPATGTQAAWQGDGMPFGTRGGIRVRHYFPRNGDYDLRAFLAKESLTPLEGVRFFRHRLRGVTAGPHTVVVTFPDEHAEREGPVMNVGGPGGPPGGGPLDVLGAAIRPSLDFLLDGKRVKRFEIHGMTAGEAAFDGQPGPPTLARIEIAGPYNAAGPGDTPSRRRIFTCRPTGDGADCARQILAPIVRRAFRRETGEADLRPFLRAFASAARDRDFESAIAAAIRDVLIAPDFLFRIELEGGEAAAAGVYPAGGFALASRLSFFLWSSIPDDRLLDAAAAGGLRDPHTREREVRRMLADRRSEALLDNFASQWLGLRALEQASPDKQLFPDYDAALASAFRTETRLFVGGLIRENRSILDLLQADHTYLDERLAAHYGVTGVRGPGFRRVSLGPQSGRAGILTHGSILVLTSHATRTSPVLRGKWILETLLNSPPPPPPANVPPLDEGPAGGRKLTAREQVERHRANPACSSCHARIDPLGFALENYDPIGRWRERDEGGPIDSSAAIPGGRRFAGAAGLRDMLLDRREEFAHAFTERLMTYALGREIEARDQPAIREILARARAGGYRFHDLILGIVESVPFRMKQKQER